MARSGMPGGSVRVRVSPTDPNRLFFDFDPPAPGGRGGASVRIDPAGGVVSIDGVYRNTLLPPRSTGGLIADGLGQTVLRKPVVLEAYNVERGTASALAAGGSGQGTRIGNMLEDAVAALNGVLIRWEPIADIGAWHLRVHINYP